MSGKRTPSWVKQRAIKRSHRNCKAKKIFKTVDEAAAFAKQFNGSQYVYPCRVCSNFHLTTNRDQH